MKKAILILTALASLTIANTQAQDDKTFFAGTHLGMTIGQAEACYRKFPKVGILWHSGAPKGEKYEEFRTSTVPQRRIYVYFREASKTIVSVVYWKLGDNETFPQEEKQFLTNLNQGHGTLTTHLSQDGSEFEVTTPKQYQIEDDEGAKFVE